ncbi:hypothetical protein N431DRAFT_542947 [Stipitochalara longipes BDJ]|nr:hypothetical protein N431DRAFT_542947 [Stipitochalara longipes BDJ]
MGKKKKLASAKAKATITAPNSKASRRAANAASKEERRAHKLALRKKEKNGYTADMWAQPAPSHLVAKLDVPRVKSKYQSYFEFAANPEKKDKKLEFKVTNDADPPPGFVFVPIGDPILTNACKELSREKDAMIFIVSTQKEEKSKISEHIHRTGYHFREVIVDEAREIVGETVVVSQPRRYGLNEIEPIPESQEEINKQADAAIRDLFPRIPNTDRTMIIEHAFKKGAMFHGEPTVGLQTNIPLSRRVQLAVLAHIRHTHTRYDKLLRETSWMNARKAVEPVCLDVLVKWRGDEETGRDQMDEIIREVVIITDSEEEDDSSDDEDSSEEEGEVTSVSSTEPSMSHLQLRLPEPVQRPRPLIASTPGVTEDDDVDDPVSSRTRARPQKDKKAQRGFKRYQAAWEEAVHRRQDSSYPAARAYSDTPVEGTTTRRPRSIVASPQQGFQRSMQESKSNRPSNLPYDFGRDDQARYNVDPMSATRPASYYSRHSAAPGPSTQRNEEIVRSQPDRYMYHQDVPARLSSPSHPRRDQGPSQVVRGSSASQVLQDLLVPSIEPVTSDVALPRLNESLGIQARINYSQDPHPRRVIEQRVHSPAPRPRAIINDSSPQVKRRRLIHEDDAGHFRPLPSRDFSLHSTLDSHLMSTSSAHSGEYLVRHPRVSSQPIQGLSRDQPIFIDPATAERLPIYDAPESGYFQTHPGYLRRTDDRPSQATSIGQISHSIRDNMSDGTYLGRSTHVGDRSEQWGMVERDRRLPPAESEYSRGSHVLRPRSPEFSVSSRTLSHSYDPSSVRDGFTILAERAPQSFVDHRNRQDHEAHSARVGFTVLAERAPQNLEDHSARSFATIPSVRTRSPVQYVERPVYYKNESRQPVYYEDSRPFQRESFERFEPQLRERHLPPEETPRRMDLRRQVIVLE